MYPPLGFSVVVSVGLNEDALQGANITSVALAQSALDAVRASVSVSENATVSAIVSERRAIKLSFDGTVTSIESARADLAQPARRR